MPDTTPLAAAAFVDYWSRFRDSGSPYVHPDDAALVRQGDFELDLLPMPINGNLAQAEAVILMLNPALDAEDYEWERNGAFRASLLRNLSQHHGPDDYPFLYLDPSFAQHPGAGYWIRRRVPKRKKRDLQKLRSVVEGVAQRDEVCVEAALAHVARKVAVLQLCPYHSAKLRRRALLNQLPSCCQARKLVQALVSSREKLVVATRSIRAWGFNEPVESPSLIVYPRALGASASFTLSSPGGKAIRQRLSRVACK